MVKQTEINIDRLSNMFRKCATIKKKRKAPSKQVTKNDIDLAWKNLDYLLNGPNEEDVMDQLLCLTL